MTRLFASLSRRSPAEWCLRIVGAVAAGTCGYAAVSHAVAVALPAGRVAQAHQLAPFSPRITAEFVKAKAAEQLLAQPAVERLSPGQRRELAEADRLARQALRYDGMALPALTTLGHLADLAGDSTRARRLFRYSEQLSRRDLSTQLWLIEDSVNRDDIDEALRHYDIVLRTKKDAPSTLFPILAAASADPEVATRLTALLTTKPAWTQTFVEYVAATTKERVATAAFFNALRRAGVSVSYVAQGALLDGMIKNSDYEAAWTYYTSVRSGADRARSRDPRFTALLDRPSLLDWVPADASSGVSAAIRPTATGASFEFAAPQSIGGQLLQQVQLLAPGRYVLEGRSEGLSGAASSSPYWKLSCLPEGRELGRIYLPPSDRNEGSFAGQVSVPGDCRAQTLNLMAQPSDQPGGISGSIDFVQLRPAN